MTDWCWFHKDSSTASESESKNQSESENESFVINNYEWVPESASEEELEEEEFDLFKFLFSLQGTASIRLHPCCAEKDSF